MNIKPDLVNNFLKLVFGSLPLQNILTRKLLVVVVMVADTFLIECDVRITGIHHGSGANLIGHLAALPVQAPGQFFFRRIADQFTPATALIEKKAARSYRTRACFDRGTEIIKFTGTTTDNNRYRHPIGDLADEIQVITFPGTVSMNAVEYKFTDTEALNQLNGSCQR